LSSQYSPSLSSIGKYLDLARQVKEIVQGFDPEAEVYLFGSVVKGKMTASGDIDILVVTQRLEHKYDMMVAVYQRLDAPIELHVTDRKMFERWYLRFIGPGEIVKI
jgi:predicted nucleotidyltransferase